MYKLSKNIQSNFPGRKKTYTQGTITYILIDYRLGAQRNVCLRNRIWMVEREAESAVSDMLEFITSLGSLKSSITNTSRRSIIKKSKTIKTNR